tara:strand:+ start:221 stop:460 length:240 start_codon:yes stop_codon:yes gene_type:complete
MNKDKIQVGDLVVESNRHAHPNLGVGLVIGVTYWSTVNLAPIGAPPALVGIYWLKKGSVGRKFASKLMKLSPTQENPNE